MIVKEAFDRVEEILGSKDLKASGKKKVREMVKLLFEHPEGRELIAAKAANRERYRNRATFLREVVSSLAEYLKHASQEEQTECVKLAQTVVDNASINEDAKWTATRLVLDTDEIAGRQSLASALSSIEPKKDVVKKYRKYAVPHMGEDGGIAALRKLAESGSYGNVCQMANAIVSAMSGPPPTVGDVASQEVGTQSESAAPLSSSEGREGTEKAPPREPTARLSPRQTLDLIEMGLPTLREILSQKTEFDRRITELEEELTRHKERTQHLHDRIQDVQDQLAARTKALEQVEHERAELRAEINRLNKQLTSVEERAQQDVAMAQNAADAAVETFKHNLWGRLRAHLSSAMDDSISEDQCGNSTGRILLRQLRKLLGALRALGVAPEDEVGAGYDE